MPPGPTFVDAVLCCVLVPVQSLRQRFIQTTIDKVVNFPPKHMQFDTCDSLGESDSVVCHHLKHFVARDRVVHATIFAR